jgi:hypothetical protein
MDTGVALVQAYLHVNGYFTVAEYPVLEAYRGDHARTVTDLDILAVRFAGASHDVIRARGRQDRVIRSPETDPLLQCPADRPDMIVGEVKEGAARFNAAMRDPAVLTVALTRFGCCQEEHARHVVQQLLTAGHAIALGHSVRMIAFGDLTEADRPGPWMAVSMRHVVQFLQQYLREHWDVLRHAQLRPGIWCPRAPRKVGCGQRGRGVDRPTAPKEESWWHAHAPRRMSDDASCSTAARVPARPLFSN